MAKTYLLGIDIGTQTLKATLVDVNGTVAADTAVSYQVLHPQPGYMEHDPEAAWWGGLVRAVREVLDTSGVAANRIAALCTCGLFPALCVADDRGRPLRHAILYGDSRAAAEVAEAQAITGARLKGDEVTQRLLWLRRHEPQVLERTARVFGVPGYVVYHLTGRHCVDAQTAFRMGGLVDDTRRNWRPEVCAGLGIDSRILPQIHSAADIVGGVHAEAARATGLAEGTPVLAGMTDSLATLLGNGITQGGEAMIYYGTTGYLALCPRDLKEVLTDPALIDDETPFDLAAYLLDFGEVLEWFIDEFFGRGQGATTNEGDLYARLEQGAAQVPAGCAGLLALPHFAGRFYPQVDPHSRGLFLGLTTGHSRFHLWRALLEAFGYEMRRGIVALEGQGIRLSRMVATGGGARSPLWRQIVADITGQAQEYVVNGATALGAAFLAGYAVGLFDDPSEIRERWLQVGSVTEPRTEFEGRYNRLFAVYNDLDRALSPHHRALVEALA